MEDVRRVLAADGIYVANLIDRPPLRFTRAEAATFEDAEPILDVAARLGWTVVSMANDWDTVFGAG